MKYEPLPHNAFHSFSLNMIPFMFHQLFYASFELLNCQECENNSHELAICDGVWGGFVWRALLENLLKWNVFFCLGHWLMIIVGKFKKVLWVLKNILESSRFKQLIKSEIIISYKYFEQCQKYFYYSSLFSNYINAFKKCFKLP